MDIINKIAIITADRGKESMEENHIVIGCLGIEMKLIVVVNKN